MAITRRITTPAILPATTGVLSGEVWALLVGFTSRRFMSGGSFSWILGWAVIETFRRTGNGRIWTEPGPAVSFPPAAPAPLPPPPAGKEFPDGSRTYSFTPGDPPCRMGELGRMTTLSLSKHFIVPGGSGSGIPASDVAMLALLSPPTIEVVSAIGVAVPDMPLGALVEVDVKLKATPAGAVLLPRCRVSDILVVETVFGAVELCCCCCCCHCLSCSMRLCGRLQASGFTAQKTLSCREREIFNTAIMSHCDVVSCFVVPVVSYKQQILCTSTRKYGCYFTGFISGRHEQVQIPRCQTCHDQVNSKGKGPVIRS